MFRVPTCISDIVLIFFGSVIGYILFNVSGSGIFVSQPIFWVKILEIHEI